MNVALINSGIYNREIILTDTMIAAHDTVVCLFMVHLFIFRCFAKAFEAA